MPQTLETVLKNVEEISKVKLNSLIYFDFTNFSFV